MKTTSKKNRPRKPLKTWTTTIKAATIAKGEPVFRIHVMGELPSSDLLLDLKGRVVIVRSGKNWMADYSARKELSASDPTLDILGGLSGVAHVCLSASLGVSRTLDTFFKAGF